MSLFNKSFISIIFDKISLLIDRLVRKMFKTKYSSESTTKKYLLDPNILERKIVKKINNVFYVLILIVILTCAIAIYSDVKYQKSRYTNEQKEYLNQVSSNLNDVSKELYDTFYDFNERIKNAKDNLRFARSDEFTTHIIKGASFYGSLQNNHFAMYGNGKTIFPAHYKQNRIKILNKFNNFYYLYKTLGWLDGISYISKNKYILSSPSSLLTPHDGKVFPTSALSFSNKFFNYILKSANEENGEKWTNESILSANPKEKTHKKHMGYLYPISIKGDSIIDGVLLAEVNIEHILTSHTKDLDYTRVVDKTNAYIIDPTGKILAGYDVKAKHMINEKELYQDNNRILTNDILSPKYMVNNVSTVENKSYTTYIKHSFYSGLTIVYSIPETNLLLEYIYMSNYLIYILIFIVAIILLMISLNTVKNISVKPMCRIINHINALNSDQYQADSNTSDVISFWQGRLRLIFSILKNKYHEIGSLSIRASVDSETKLPKQAKFISMIQDALNKTTATKNKKKKNKKTSENEISDLQNETDDSKNSVVIVFNIENFSHLSTIYSSEVMDTLIKQFASSLLLFSNAYENKIHDQHYIFSRLTATKFSAFIQVSGSIDIESVVNQLATSLSSPIIIPNGDTLILKIYIGASIILGNDLFNPKKAKSILKNNIKKAGIALSYASEYDDLVKYANEDILAVESFNMEQKQRLLNAIKTKTFDMVFQPYFDIKTKSIKGIEALMRWDQTDIMPISTSQIIEQAKRNNLVTEIDKILFEKIEQSTSILNAVPMPNDPYIISLNVSVAYFFSPEFSAFISRLHKSLDETKWTIAIEIHEDLMYDNITNINTQIARIKQQQNIIISIDNFGAGRASLEALTKVPVDTIKLSPTITSNLNTDSHYKQIVSLLKHLKLMKNIQIVAVGLNNSLSLTQLNELGIDVIQSYKIGKITDLKETIDIISDQETVDEYFKTHANEQEG